MAEKYVVRRMREDEVALSIDWAFKEGWNPGLNDAKCFYQADKQGFFVGLLNDEPIATGSAVIYDDHFAFCGLYIVKPEFRSHGFGLELTEERLRYAGERITGLDGVLDKVSVYERIGYVKAHLNRRYECKLKLSSPQVPEVVDLKKVPFKEIEEFDRKYFPAPRSAFLHSWIFQPKAYALGFVKEKKLHGYGVIRKCFNGYKIGPLFADSPDVADILFQSLNSKITNGPVYLDIPEPNKEALALAKKYKMTSKFEVIRMYRNGTPEIDLPGVFGISTFELG